MRNEIQRVQDRENDTEREREREIEMGHGKNSEMLNEKFPRVIFIAYVGSNVMLEKEPLNMVDSHRVQWSHERNKNSPARTKYLVS